LKFLKQARASPINPLVSFEGKNVVVTSANTSLGFRAASKFVALDAFLVILGIRDLIKGNHAKAVIEECTGKKDRVEI
jgi:NAD(P)-dependent dehydrogenase (short-subunit alcohol dehydrogenase family)